MGKYSTDPALDAALTLDAAMLEAMGQDPGPTLQDIFPDAEQTLYLVATDTFMSGWGGAPGKSYVACAFDGREQLQAAQRWMNGRREMANLHVTNIKPVAGEGDDVVIWTPETHPHVFGLPHK